MSKKKRTAKWEFIINQDSKNGTWNWNYLKSGDSIRILKYSTSQPLLISEIKMNVKEWKELAKLINRITKKSCRKSS